MVIIIMRKTAVLLGMSTAERHVGFTADDRLDAHLFGLAIKLDRPEHIAMVRHGHSGLIERFNLPDQRLNLIGAIEETELGVEVKMHEGRSHGGGFYGDGEGKSNGGECGVARRRLKESTNWLRICPRPQSWRQR